ncbi:DUF922 domain-containing protein [Flaviaesturariibacter aridisoli]|uniref:DUF922 domain-containing protein n=1 Tax=Flaviaesturariibacter aridisoli TaxID=2545761 RepID=A0A4R4DYE1_9BACT|nr:DUF922 domain-containing protein [Flaviaesturariibacter aridisoli]TCZ68628.1 DUF922 domain-containing protein [Flaviaesturariibacter aridisoli]
MNLTSLGLPILLLAFSGMRLTSAAPEVTTATTEPSLLIAAVSSEKPLREESPELIPWTARRIVGWEDFQSAPVTGTEAVASTSTSLGLTYQLKDGVLTYNVTCNFQKTKSWGLMKTEYILAHEQAHFDITELSARRLHQELSSYVFDRRTFKADLSRIYNAVVAEKEALQNTYDRETDHSRNRKVQAEWLQRIDQQLADTEPYASYP